MTWRCALIQRWLPEYPDAEAAGFKKRLAARHLQHCPECRRELQAIEETIRLVQTHPVADPGPEFWDRFNQELHLKLAQVNQAPVPEPNRRLLPYFLAGAPALAVLLLWLGGYLGTLPMPPARLAETPKEAAPLTAAPAREDGVELAAHGHAGGNHLPGPEKVLYAGIDEGLWEDEALNWEVDPVLADLSQQEREALARKLTGREP
jgi:hypothetical protein